MADEAMGRRSVLRGAGAASGGAALVGLAHATPAAAGEPRGSGSLSGSWRLTVRNDDGRTTISVLSLATGQVCVVNDVSPAGPLFTGTWRTGRRRSFRATVLAGIPGDEPGSPGPVVELVLTGTARDELDGTFTFAVTAPTGEEVGTGSGTFTGERIAP